ncbi:YbhB/YbcL family Raf kinase inhibitor-like protein [Gemmobacter sp. LW-1]|uniref:YbhB/YbcL family Raf kinase inhibitor-like protein n=1 Tax=Gemmobacter sp. LW-1 TaxID=1529005 RepID=UPI0006C74C1D|nr:YbhB/YbcL family Raf kinase inhibitor-like protein [Gemmobacter sp. LW-1]OJY32140.1 MAG: phosphatidylethanolamine-binding protein [Rhodobacterales bacterium 65-51]
MRSFYPVLLAASLIASGAEADMVLTSDALGTGTLGMDQVFNGFGCTGSNISPDLAWHGAPEGTGAFVLMMHDPDAPTGSGWWHWSVANLPADVTGLPAGASGHMPDGAVETATDFGTTGFGGACPPEGDAPHHYTFTLYALPAPLPEGALASPAMVSFMARAQALGSASLTATYGR